MFLISLALAVAVTGAGTQSARKPPPVPETFRANANVTGTAGAGAATLKIRIDRYVADHDRDTIRAALKSGGYAAFLPVLRAAPVLGQITMADQTFTIRWATQEPIANGRAIVVVTDQPVFFVGGGAVNAKPRAGYEVAVIRIEIEDNAGFGRGEMAAAARVKPGGTTGVVIDDYAEKPIKLISVSKEF
jgi:hypothetical protein